MAQATLYEALYTFYERYDDALARDSQRIVEILTKQCIQISNYWNLYIQAKAEGNTTGADLAIGQMVTLLGGDIDITNLPNIGGVVSERDGSEAVTAVATKINFVSDIGTVDYRLLINLHDSSGVPLGYVLGTLESDGFTITPSFPGTLIYNAKILT